MLLPRVQGCAGVDVVSIGRVPQSHPQGVGVGIQPRRDRGCHMREPSHRPGGLEEAYRHQRLWCLEPDHKTLLEDHGGVHPAGTLSDPPILHGDLPTTSRWVPLSRVAPWRESAILHPKSDIRCIQGWCDVKPAKSSYLL